VIPRPHPILVLDPLAKRLPPILANTYLPTIWAHINAGHFELSNIDDESYWNHRSFADLIN